MKQPITQLKQANFPQANKVLTKPEGMTDEQCRSLVVFNDGIQTVSRWKLTFIQRLIILFTGNVWLCVLAGSSQPPVWLDISKTVFLEEKEGEPVEDT